MSTSSPAPRMRLFTHTRRPSDTYRHHPAGPTTAAPTAPRRIRRHAADRRRRHGLDPERRRGRPRQHRRGRHVHVGRIGRRRHRADDRRRRRRPRRPGWVRDPEHRPGPRQAPGGGHRRQGRGHDPHPALRSRRLQRRLDERVAGDGQPLDRTRAGLDHLAFVVPVSRRARELGHPADRARCRHSPLADSRRGDRLPRPASVSGRSPPVPRLSDVARAQSSGTPWGERRPRAGTATMPDRDRVGRRRRPSSGGPSGWVRRWRRRRGGCRGPAAGRPRTSRGRR